jgi:hypothetical protein
MKEFINEIRGIISDTLLWWAIQVLPEKQRWELWGKVRVHFSRVEYDENAGEPR